MPREWWGMVEREKMKGSLVIVESCRKGKPDLADLHLRRNSLEIETRQPDLIFLFLKGTERLIMFLSLMILKLKRYKQK